MKHSFIEFYKVLATVKVEWKERCIIYMKHKQMILLFLMLVVITIIGFLIAIYKRIRHLKTKEDTRFFVTEKKSYLYSIYKRLVQFPFTKRYIKNIYKKFEIYEPSDVKNVAIRTMKEVLKNWTISICLAAIIFIINPTFVNTIIAVLVIVVYTNYRMQTSIAFEEINFLQVFEKYLDDIKHYYYKYNSVEDAIYESINDLKQPLRIHIEKIYEILNSSDIKSNVENYRLIAPNRYIMLFLSLCVAIQRYGESDDDESIFLKNLIELKKDINEELNKRNKLIYRMQGLIPLAIFPMCSIELIKSWGISNLSELESFYNGTAGIIIAVLSVLVSLVSYNMLMEIKQIKSKDMTPNIIFKRIENIRAIHKILEGYIYKNYSRILKIKDYLRRVGSNLTIQQFIIKRWLFTISTMIGSVFLILIIHQNNRNMYLHKTDNFINKNNVASEKQRKEIDEIIRKITMEHKDNKHITEDEIMDQLIISTTFKNKQIMSITTHEIYQRLIKYQNEYFHWYELIICILLSVFANYVPYLYLIYQNRLVQMDMEDEIIQFQTIIVMLMNIERISVYEILENLEDYAIIFKRTISECRDNYTSGDIEALEHMKEEENFSLFKHLVDNLIMCDQIGCKKAFNEIWVERNINQEKRKFDNEKLLGNKLIKATIIAWVPFVIILFMYLLIPFSSESISQYKNVEYEMEQINKN